MSKKKPDLKCQDINNHNIYIKNFINIEYVIEDSIFKHINGKTYHKSFLIILHKKNIYPLKDDKLVLQYETEDKMLQDYEALCKMIK